MSFNFIKKFDSQFQSFPNFTKIAYLISFSLKATENAIKIFLYLIFVFNTFLTYWFRRDIRQLALLKYEQGGL